MRVGTNATQRWPGNRMLIVGDIVVDGDDQVWTNTTSGSTGLTHMQNIRVEGVAVKVSSSLVNVSNYALQGDWAFSGCVWSGSSFGTTNPGGITEADPTFSDRGDGIQTPGHGDISYGVNVCFPGRLEGGAISDLGATW